MDLTHAFLGGALLISIVVSIIGFWLMTRRQEKDEAIDAATFLALRDLQEYLRRSKS